MDAEISDTGIAVMCDIARASGLTLDADKQAVLDRLIAQGLVERSDTVDMPDNAHAENSHTETTFAVTPKGQRLLDERGVGVNEA